MANEAEAVKEPKAKQQRLPGMKPQHIAEVEELAEALRDVRTERMDLTQREVKAQDDLLGAMKKHKVREYRLGNLIFVVSDGKTKVRMKRVSDDEEEAAE